MTQPDAPIQGRAEEMAQRRAEKMAAAALKGDSVAAGERIPWLDPRQIARHRAEFAWGHRIILHDLNLIVGDEGAGKGLVAVYLASALSTGELLGHPASAGYGSTEEATGIVRMRLEAARSDLSRVRILPMGSVGLPEAIPMLVASMRAEGLGWLLLDPINAHFSHGLDPTRAKDVGIVLGELAKMATEERLTVLGNLHTNRGGGITSRERYAHQLEFRRRTRSAVIIGQLQDGEEGERVIVHDKHNYSTKDPALAAVIREKILEVDGKPTGVPVLEIGGEIDATAEDLFVAEADREGAIARAKGARTKVASASHHILGVWRRAGQPREMKAGMFSELAKTYDRNAVARARKNLGITTEPVRGDDGRITGNRWLFPSELASEPNPGIADSEGR